jgi:hypothetical protein
MPRDATLPRRSPWTRGARGPLHIALGVRWGRLGRRVWRGPAGARLTPSQPPRGTGRSPLLPAPCPIGLTPASAATMRATGTCYKVADPPKQGLPQPCTGCAPALNTSGLIKAKMMHVSLQTWLIQGAPVAGRPSQIPRGSSTAAAGALTSTASGSCPCQLPVARTKAALNRGGRARGRRASRRIAAGYKRSDS